MYKYDDAVLKKLQNVELEIFKKFDSICEKYGIEYFVSFGTAIGAVRHKGFIPWDDDIDVGMMREEYEKLKHVPKEEWGDLILVDPMDDWGLHRSIYPRIYKSGTVFETEYHYKYSSLRDEKDGNRLPIWFDIFCFDRVSTPKAVKNKLFKTFVLKKLYYYAKCKVNILPEDSLKTKLSCLLKQSAFYTLNIIKNPEKKIYKSFLKTVTKTPGEYVTSFELDHNSQTVKFFHRYDEMFPVVKTDFEDIKVSIQKNYDDMLTKSYGNYMEMPPAHLRYNHPPAIIDFGDGTKFVNIE